MPTRIIDNVLLDKDLTSFTVSGDPGCDGYNVESAAVLEAIVKLPANLHLLLGDLVPTGREHWFKQFTAILRRSASAPVFCLLGNHDRPDYDKHLGKVDYYIRARNALIVILDNASWKFADASVEFLRETLAAHAAGVDHLFLAFHVPLPNAFSPNSVPPKEWAKVRDALLPYQGKVRAIFSGHVHSAFQFELDGFPVIVTGGGGAQLDPVPNTFFSVNSYHVIHVRLIEGAWRFVAEAVLPGGDGNVYADEENGRKITATLEESFAGEAMAFQRYRLFAERADLSGQPGLAKLFRAAADSERYHAANMLLAMGGIGLNEENLEASIAREEKEWTTDYPRHLEEAEASKVSSRAAVAFDRALKAEKVHHSLFGEALAALRRGEQYPIKQYFTCKRCGYTHAGDAPPAICPACGTDQYRFVEVAEV